MDELTPNQRIIAYFSMEIGLRQDIPTYSGGLGMLAGDTLKACADLKVPVVGVTLVSSKGYFLQHINRDDGWQTESPVDWDLSKNLKLQNAKAIVHIQGRPVTIRAWQYEIVGVGGFKIPVIYLDTNQPENSEFDRTLTNQLYGGDKFYRLCQEVVLGIGGTRMLHALGYKNLDRYHMNEGHAALLSLELVKERAIMTGLHLDEFNTAQECMIDHSHNSDSAKECVISGLKIDESNTAKECIEWVRKHCVFTTHTPVAAGHDKFEYEMVQDVMRGYLPSPFIQQLAGLDFLNMTLLALNLSHYVNSVAKKHMDVSQHLFPGYHFSNITNGVHSATWTSPEMQKLFDHYTPGWRQDSFELRHALTIPKHMIWEAHQKTKEKLVEYINQTYDAGFDVNIFTIGFARRATSYKRANLLFYNIARLRQIGAKQKIQIIFGGKAHPNDVEGKELIKTIFWHMGELRDCIKIVYVENYDMDLAKLMTAGADLWLNTPARPHEASGTSGMKAAHNGVPQFSILDGWWIEGHLEGITGWRLGPTPTEENESENDDAVDSDELYDKLDNIILALYYYDNKNWQRMMRNTIAFNASYFNTHRMVQQYVLNAYLL